MKRLFIIISLLSYILPFSLDAQTLTNSERRHINNQVLTLINEYERYASVYDEEAEWYFLQLFEERSTPVYCDLMGQYPYLKQIPVSEYVGLIKSNSANTNVVLRNVRKGRMSYVDGLWHIPVIFSKSVSYIDNSGYLFSAREYHSSDFEITMDVIYDHKTDCCKVRSISGDLNSSREFPEGRFLIVQDLDPSEKRGNYQRYFSTLKVGGSRFTFNSFGQSIISSGKPTVYDPEVIIKVDTLLVGQNYDVISFKGFKQMNGRARVRLGYAPFMYKLKDHSKIPGLDFSSHAFEITADAGRAFLVGGSSKLSFNGGLGLSFSRVALDYSPAEGASYVYKVYGGVQSGLSQNHDISYTVKKAHQAISYVDLVVPVYLELEHKFGTYVSLTCDLGLKGYIALQAKSKSPYTVSFDAEGPSGVTGADNWNPSQYINPNSYGKQGFDLSVMANLGADINVLGGLCVASIRLGYEQGLMSLSYSSGTGPYFNSQNNNYPIIYGGGEHIAVHSLISNVAFNRSGLWISTGIKYKF